MNLEGKKISGSRNWAIWGLDFLDRYDPDALRYYLTANMPESKDTDWDWQDFLSRNNNELVATWGNLANRVISFAYKNWEGKVPEPGELRPADLQILHIVESGFDTIGKHINAVNLRAGLSEAMRLAAEVNKYLDTTAPWFEIKTDKPAAGTTIFTALKAIDSLKILFAPYIPFSSEQLHKILGYDEPLFGKQFTEIISDNLGEHEILRYNSENATGVWQASQLSPGSDLVNPTPLFRKLDEEIVQSERARLGHPESSQD
jgi:methionyl-tRNA synthetase